MASNKSYILIHLLSNAEFDLFCKALEIAHKSRQLVLAKALKNAEDFQVHKPFIFQKTYGVNYTKDKDYLLRNDLRKLRQLILKFLEDNVYSSNQSLDYYKFLLDKKAYHLFDKEIQKAIEHLKKTPNHTLYEHQILWFEFILRYKPRKESDLKAYRLLILKAIEQSPDIQIYYKNYFILLLSTLERIIWQYFEIEFTNLEAFFNQNRTRVHLKANYCFEKAKSFQLFGNARIKQLNICHSALNELGPDSEQQSEQAYLNSQLGLEYFLMPKFELSQHYYEKAYASFNILNESQKIQLIYNYASLLCASGQYNEVIQLLQTHAAIFDKTPYENNVSLFSIMAHINTHQTDNLRALLPKQNEQATKDAELYWRVLESIILYYEGAYELCITYLENIYNTSRYNKQLDKAFVELSKIFQHFISALIIIDKSDQKKKLEACKLESDIFIKSYQLGFGSNSLCSVWLNKQINQMLQD